MNACKAIPGDKEAAKNRLFFLMMLFAVSTGFSF
jgi:hypothetical protein